MLPGLRLICCHTLWRNHQSPGGDSVWTDAENILKCLRLIETLWWGRDCWNKAPMLCEWTWKVFQLLSEPPRLVRRSQNINVFNVGHVSCHHSTPLVGAGTDCGPFCCHFEHIFSSTPIWSPFIARLWTAVCVLPTHRLSPELRLVLKLSEPQAKFHRWVVCVITNADSLFMDWTPAQQRPVSELWCSSLPFGSFVYAFLIYCLVPALEQTAAIYHFRPI